MLPSSPRYGLPALPLVLAPCARHAVFVCCPFPHSHRIALTCLLHTSCVLQLFAIALWALHDVAYVPLLANIVFLAIVRGGSAVWLCVSHRDTHVVCVAWYTDYAGCSTWLGQEACSHVSHKLQPFRASDDGHLRNSSGHGVRVSGPAG